MMLGYEPFLVNCWIDQGMSIQIEPSQRKGEKRRNGALTTIRGWVASSAVVAALSVTSFSWAATVQVPFSSLHNLAASGSRDWGDAVPVDYYGKLMARLREAPRVVEDNSPDPESAF